MKKLFLYLPVLLTATCALDAAEATAKVTWTHDTRTAIGPVMWGSTAAENATCGTTIKDAFTAVGKKQTPVNIETGKTTVATLPSLTFQYKDTPFVVENTGHVIEVPYATGSTIRLATAAPYGPVGYSQPTDEYQLIQFHFHTPSEHTIDGKQYAMEMHLVHQNQLGDLAVVGLMLDQTTEPTYLLDQIVASAPADPGDNDMHDMTLNARQLLPASLNYYMYSGSLTTPPCSEGVRWFLLKTPMPVSAYAVQRMQGIISHMPGYDGFKFNNRPVLPLNGRSVLVNR